MSSSLVALGRSYLVRYRGFRRRLSTSARIESDPQYHSEEAQPELAGRATSTLPLPGGDVNADRRRMESARIAEDLRKLALPPHGRIHPRDCLWQSEDLCFVGVGRETTWPALHAAMNADIFRTRRVIAVRDIFDRQPSRAVLRDFCDLALDDVVAVTRPVVRDVSFRRLVNEYTRPEGVADGLRYRLVKNDVSFITWLHNNGFRMLNVPDKAGLAAAVAGNVPTQQSSNHALMVSPTAFRFNSEAAEDNRFMDRPEGNSIENVRTSVLREYAALYDRLTDRVTGAGAVIHQFTAEAWHETPDALFPNNVFSTHTAQETGDKHASICLYPMKSPSRRRERRPEFLNRLLSFGRYASVLDLSKHEDSPDASFLEGTGSLVLDRRNRIAYMATSPRSDPALARTWGRIMNYRVMPFASVDSHGDPIYHTNVMMAVGTHAAVVCSESIPDAKSREMVLDSLRSTGHEIIEISLKQVSAFCGNVLEMESYYGEQVFVMSSQAFGAFTEEQREMLLDSSSGLIHSDISTIERVGGGGVRCTIAELY